MSTTLSDAGHEELTCPQCERCFEFLAMCILMRVTCPDLPPCMCAGSSRRLRRLMQEPAGGPSAASAAAPPGAAAAPTWQAVFLITAAPVDVPTIARNVSARTLPSRFEQELAASGAWQLPPY